MKKCLNEKEILFYIKSKSKSPNIKQHLTECPKCYSKYIEIKELLYFKEKKIDISKKTVTNILSMYKNYKHINRFTLILKATKKALEVFTDTNFELKSEFIIATLITKGESINKVDGDIVSLKKYIDNYGVELDIQKIKKDKYQIIVKISKKASKKQIKNFIINLKTAKQDIEKLDLKKNNTFNTLLSPDNYSLEFYSKGKLLFVIDLKIKNEK